MWNEQWTLSTIYAFLQGSGYSFCEAPPRELRCYGLDKIPHDEWGAG